MELERFTGTFSTTFALKDLGILSYFRDIEVLYDTDCLYLSQRKYIRDLLTKVDMIECKGVDTPISTGLKLQKVVQGELVYFLEDPSRYRSIVGGVQYLILTRPEIAFVVNKITKNELVLSLYSLSSKTSRYAHFGHNRLTVYGHPPFMLQKLTAQQSDYRLSGSEKPTIWCDNISATELARNPVYHLRTKHIEIDMHFIRNRVVVGELNIQGHCQLPSGLGNFSKLQTFRAGFSYLSGSIPDDVSAAASLEDISLPVNQLSGAISNGSFPLTLTSCMFLTAIRLSGNKIEEQISPTILALVSVSYLSINNNNLSNITGAIGILMGCKNLRMLLLCKIFFHEAIPDENQITISSYAFQNLVVLGIGNCEIKGQIPTWLGKLKKLQVLDLGSNQITGPIPGWLGNMPNLFYIDLSYNSISGEFPKEFCGLPALALQEAKNRADGNQLQLPLFVPETKCALYNQQYNKLFSLPPAIYLRNNGLNGSIPIEIGNVMFLHVLDLSLNNFSGEI
ncbi:Receptor-like protein 3 [Citrus sinensis]|nr:Receptor-like protein 3 [Citrus sinensis]